MMHESGAVDYDNQSASSWSHSHGGGGGGGQGSTTPSVWSHQQHLNQNQTNSNVNLPTVNESTEYYNPYHHENGNDVNGESNGGGNRGGVRDTLQRRGLGGNRSPRVIHWFAFFLISIITLGSSMEATEPAHEWRTDVTQKQRWAVACSLITFLITFTVVYMHTSTKYSIFIISTKLEGFFIVILLLFWIATVAVVSDAENGLAVNEEGVVIYGNLYYFSWGGLVVVVMLFVSYLRSIYFINVVEEFRGRSPRLMIWSAFLTSAMIVMGSGASIYDLNCNVISPERKFCSRTQLAISLGIIGTVSGILMVGMKIAIANAAPFWLEFPMSVILFLLYAFGVAYITSEKGPGAPLGNLYYATWACFLESFFICVGCFESYQEMVANGRQSEEMVMREMEAEKLTGNDNDEEMFDNYDYDDYDNDNVVQDEYEENVVDDVQDDYATKQEQNQDARSVYSSGNNTNYDDAKSVRSSFTGGGGNYDSSKSVRSFFSATGSRSVPLNDDEDDIPMDRGSSFRSSFTQGTNYPSDAKSVQSASSSFVRHNHPHMARRSSAQSVTSQESNPMNTGTSSSRRFGVPMSNVEIDARSVRSVYSGSRSIPLDDDDDDDAPWLQNDQNSQND